MSGVMMMMTMMMIIKGALVGNSTRQTQNVCIAGLAYESELSVCMQLLELNTWRQE
jgi:hypothetical protein